MFLALLACSTPGSTPPPADAPTWHADVEPIVTRSCTGCHTEGGNAPVSLTSYASAASWKDAIAEAVGSRTMPPWLASPDCNTYQGDRSLTEEEIATILAWADAGAPEGDVATAVVSEPLADPVLDSVDLTIAMPEAYTPTASPDDYRCFLIDWPLAERAYVTGFEVNPGNLQTVHHAIPFLVDAADVEAYRALDAADPAPGYTCYGSPNGDPRALESTRWLGSWAPGGGTATFPAGSGIRVEPGSVVALQMHYNVANGGGDDLTSVDFQLADAVEHSADLQPWTDIAWVLGGGMDIPAHTDGVTHTFAYTATEDDGSFFLHSSALHMHTRGKSASLVIQRAGEEDECLLAVEQYDFDWQRSYYFDAPATVNPGDTVLLTCTWDNPGDDDLDWGEGTGDEMCLATTFLTDAY
ncbi:MAG: hypothetical protein Q8P18_13835 [Pseudomonadota bacterium]|nr:hypothetical protein [Pseudomonadota bacterium]